MILFVLTLALLLPFLSFFFLDTALLKIQYAIFSVCIYSKSVATAFRGCVVSDIDNLLWKKKTQLSFHFYLFISEPYEEKKTESNLFRLFISKPYDRKKIHTL